MTDQSKVQIRVMTPEDYDGIMALWKSIHGFGLRSIDDSREGITRFLRRNPTTSVVAEDEGRIVGTILCGHDGRQACFYHVCVDEAYRQHHIGSRMTDFAVEALRREQINRVYLIAFKRNEVGNTFWQRIGWEFRQDRNYYELYINEENRTVFSD